MIKKNARRVLYPMILVVAWTLMAYAVLFGGFSTSLADYGGGGGGTYCPSPYSCGNFGCHAIPHRSVRNTRLILELLARVLSTAGK
jgi:hypothetical protein